MIWQAACNESRKWPWTAVYKNTFITEMACRLSVNICFSFVRRFSCCDSLITICFYFLGKWQPENEAASFLTELNPEKMRWQLHPSKCYRMVEKRFRNVQPDHFTASVEEPRASLASPETVTVISTCTGLPQIHPAPSPNTQITANTAFLLSLQECSQFKSFMWHHQTPQGTLWNQCHGGFTRGWW